METTEDALLGGAVRLRQPTQGYRAAIDPVLLAAAVPARPRDTVLDLGCGVGAAAFCLTARVPGATVTGLELQPPLAELARANAALNGLGDRVTLLTGDLLSPPPELEAGTFDHVMANPPYQDAAHGHPPPDASKATAHVEGEATLTDWIATALSFLKRKGRLTLIHRADRLDAILAGLGDGAGETVVFPLWPKAGQPAKRVLVTARKGVATPLRLAPGLVLHEDDGAYTPAARSVLDAPRALPL